MKQVGDNTIFELADPDYQAIARSRFSDAQVTLHRRKFQNERASFVMVLLERWGMVQGKEGGEDSSGRAKLALMPVDEVISRAFDVTEKAFAEFEKRGWTIPLPAWEDAFPEKEDKTRNR